MFTRVGFTGTLTFETGGDGEIIFPSISIDKKKIFKQ